MFYEAELTFLRRLLANFQVNTTFWKESDPVLPEFDLGLRAMTNTLPYEEPVFYLGDPLPEPNTIYKLRDEFSCFYIILELPDMEERTFMSIGPYVRHTISKQMIYDAAKVLELDTKILWKLEQYFSDLPLISADKALLSVVATFGEVIWKGRNNFKVKEVQKDRVLKPEALMISAFSHGLEKDAFLNASSIEKRYGQETELMDAVSHGSMEKALALIEGGPDFIIEQRASSPIQNTRNYSIILNTLLRKAAQAGHVHPMHIDNLSSWYARRIEMLNTEAEAKDLRTDMVTNYCHLVSEHSLKGYSQLIREVIVRIESDLSADLSLKTLAEASNLNASYLSSLFKKETGKTLTEYVTEKRMEMACYLLQYTGLQIQDIAENCGIHDVNYFTKVFKRTVHMTPKEYRNAVK